MRQKTIRESLIGTWRLMSYQAKDAQGKISNPLGRDLVGLLCYMNDGFMSMQVMRADRPGYSSSDFRIGLMEEMPAAANEYVACAGRFSVDEAASTVTHHVQLSSLPVWVGTDQNRTVTFRADRLYLEGGFVKIRGTLLAPQTVWDKVPS